MRRLIDLESGEIITDIKDDDKVQILRKESIDYLNGLKDYVKVPADEKFTKIYSKGIKEILKYCKLTSSELHIIIFLSTNLRYNSNVAQHENGHMISREAISNEFGFNQEVVNRAIRKLIKEGILITAMTTQGLGFVLNPYLFHVGDRINRTTHDLFKKTRWARGWDN